MDMRGHEDAVSLYTYFITAFIYFQNTCNPPIINIYTSYVSFHFFKYKVTSITIDSLYFDEECTLVDSVL